MKEFVRGKVAKLLTHPHSLVSLSDAGAHLTFFNDAGFGLHLMGHWARERGVMSLAEAVRRLTHQSAALFGLPGRGLLREGYAADLLLFDPATVGRAKARRVHDLPGGAAYELVHRVELLLDGERWRSNVLRLALRHGVGFRGDHLSFSVDRPISAAKSQQPTILTSWARCRPPAAATNRVPAPVRSASTWS